jgi:hypothetical protein
LSRSRNAVLCVAAGLTALVLNSVTAYALGRRPSVFDGTVFLILLTMWVLAWAAFVIIDRHAREQRAERARNYRDAIAYARRRRPSCDSGSWSRPS